AFWTTRTVMLRSPLIQAAIAALALAGGASCKKSEEASPLKIGLVAAFSGPFADHGRQMEAGIRAYLKQNGDTVAGKKIEILMRDTTGPAPEIAKRLAQELVAQDKVDFLVGFGFTPEALAAAPIATEAKTPMIIMNAATSIIPTKSPYIVRFSMTLPQISAPMGEWAAKNGIHKVATLVADYAPGIDAESAFTKAFKAQGGEIIDSVRVPLKNPDFSAFVQRLKDKQPEAVFVFVPNGEQSIGLMKTIHKRNLAGGGIKILATRDAKDDHVHPTTGDTGLGVITTFHYSVAHDSPENKAFLAAYRDANPSDRGPANFVSVAAYDGMAGIFQVMKKLEGKMNGDAAMAVLKGLSITSPRGPISIDPETRDIVQTVYVRRVEKKNNEYQNAEFQQFANVKDVGR